MSDPFSPATRATYDAYNRIGLYNEPSFETDRKALALVEQHEDGWRPSPKDWDTIRQALEALPND